MKKQAEILDSKECRQNIFRIAKQKKKERKDITGTNCLKGDNGELLVSEEQVSGRWREYFEKLLNEEKWVEWWAVSWICWRTSWHDQQRRGKTGNTRPKGEGKQQDQVV